VVFNSYNYALFLPVVLALYWLLKERKRQNALLLVASYVFYGAWDYRFLGLMWLSTVTDFTVGRLLAREQDERRRKLIFGLSLLVNLGILGFFKYEKFFADSFTGFMTHFGLHPDVPTLNLLLPVGISFYTFHGISYTFDVYRRDLRPTENILDFACFISYFPQLVSGPIGRAHIQLPQFHNPRTRPRFEEIESGLFLILLGLFKKIAIADALSPFVDRAFASNGRAGWVALLVGAFGFTMQVYGDLSGYSDIARGTSRLFGIELLKNFEQPYLSKNFTEFWRTWHISLSTWLRDYLYVPLGGNRRGEVRSYFNLLLTMTIAGLWHGSGWNYVVWGSIAGFYLATHRAMVYRRKGRTEAAGVPGGVEAVETTDHPVGTLPTVSFRRDAPKIAATVSLHALSLAIFRSKSSLHAGITFVAGIFTLRAGPIPWDGVIILLYATLVMYAIDIWQRNSGSETPVLAWPVAARGLVFGSLIVPMIVFSGGNPVPFIYFQF
jgi:D-alanyl-lipoteichoic acid acyltransferase DltB (MBOAT superfamily)